MIFQSYRAWKAHFGCLESVFKAFHEYVLSIFRKLCASWALDIAPTLDVPVLFIIASSVFFTRPPNYLVSICYGYSNFAEDGWTLCKTTIGLVQFLMFLSSGDLFVSFLFWVQHRHFRRVARFVKLKHAADFTEVFLVSRWSSQHSIQDKKEKRSLLASRSEVVICVWKQQKRKVERMSVVSCRQRLFLRCCCLKGVFMKWLN